jgi:hypothetical protein
VSLLPTFSSTPDSEPGPVEGLCPLLHVLQLLVALEVVLEALEEVFRMLDLLDGGVLRTHE